MRCACDGSGSTRASSPTSASARTSRGCLGEFAAPRPTSSTWRCSCPGRACTCCRTCPRAGASSRWRPAGYTVREQVAVLTAALRAGVDVLHVPHYVIPAASSRARLVVTVHDIIHVLFPEFLPPPLGVRLRPLLHPRRGAPGLARDHRVADHGARPARGCSGPTEARLRRHPARRREDVPRRRRPGARTRPSGAASGCPDRYLLHVGNHKPHKNAEGLLKAYQILVLRPARWAAAAGAGGRLHARRAARSAGRARMGLGGRVHVPRVPGAARAGRAVPRRARCSSTRRSTRASACRCWRRWRAARRCVAGDVAAVREVAGDARADGSTPATWSSWPTPCGGCWSSPELRAGCADKGRGAGQASSAGGAPPRRHSRPTGRYEGRPDAGGAGPRLADHDARRRGACSPRSPASSPRRRSSRCFAPPGRVWRRARPPPDPHLVPAEALVRRPLVIAACSRSCTTAWPASTSTASTSSSRPATASPRA